MKRRDIIVYTPVIGVVIAALGLVLDHVALDNRKTNEQGASNTELTREEAQKMVDKESAEEKAKMGVFV